jgi:uncharacterized protein (TIRG00374 family)
MIPGIVLGFVILVILSLAGDIQKVGQEILAFNWWMFPAALGFTLFNYALRFLKWHYYLGQIGAKDVPWRESLRLFVGGFPLAVTPGKVGEALKGVWLNQLCGLPVARGVAVVVAERISDGLAVLGLSVLGVVTYPQYWFAFAVVLVLLLGVVVVTQIRPLALWIFAQGEKVSFLRRGIAPLREFYEGSFALFRPSATLLAVGLGVVSWLGEGVGFFLILHGLGLPLSGEILTLAIFVLAFSTVVGAVSTMPGGLGAAELSIAGMLLLHPLVAPATASAATLLIRLATLWFGVCLGLVVWAVSPQLFNRRANHAG